MKWSVNDIYEVVKLLVRKNQSGSISPKDLFYYWNIEQNMYHADIVGRWQNRNNGKTGENTGLLLNETILTDLSPFTINETLTITAHKVTKPDDFEYRLAMRIDGNIVYMINAGQKSQVLDSVIDAPSTIDGIYYALEYEDYYDLLPTTLPTVAITELELDYIASCTDVKWGYTLDANDRPVYNPGTSVQPKWKQSTIVTITKRTLTNLGVSYKDADFTNFGRQAQATGD